MKHNPTRVLVVDDSRFVRDALTDALKKVPTIEVVGSAGDPYEASELIVRLQPDVMTLDMEMPRMHGTEFLRRLLPQWPIPVIMVSSHTARGTSQAMDALSAGAVEVVFKPRHYSEAGFHDMMHELVRKIQCASQAQVQGPLPGDEPRNPKLTVQSHLVHTSPYKLIAMGASTGGPQAITLILRRLPQEMPGIVIAQHLPSGFSRFFAERLQQETPLITKEAEDGELIQRGHIYIAPCGLQTEVRAVGHELHLRVFKSNGGLSYNPSVDVLFHSVAQHIGRHAIGILLTGMGQDGAYGLKSMYEAGAFTIGQNQRSSVVYGMPQVAKEIGAVKSELPLTSIAPEVLKTLGGTA